MKPRALLVLALLVAGLGAFIWFYERELPSSEERVQAAKKLLRLEAEDVDWVEIEWQGKKVRLEREAAPPRDEEADEEGDEEGDEDAAPARPWRLTAPLAALADRFAVERLVDSLVGIEKERTIEDADRSALGLEAPRARVTLGGGERTTTVEVGAEVPASNSMIVALAGEPEAYAVGKHLFADLTKEPGEWRSRDLFTGQRDDVERLALEGPGGRTLLAERGDGFWIESPIVDRADRDTTNQLLGQVTGLRAHAFLDAPPPAAELGLEPPRGVVEAVLEGREAPFRVEVGAPVPGAAERTYARVEGLVFETEARLAESLERAPAAWRSLAWSGLEVYQIDRVEVTGWGEPLELARDGGDWRRGETKVAYTPVSDFLYGLAEARGDVALDRAAAEARGARLGAPDLELELGGSDERQETLRLYPALADGALPATAGGREAVLLLPAATAGDLRAKLDALRSAEPLPADAEDEGE